MYQALPDELLKYFLYFSFSAFLGWILESTYRSIKEKHLANAGFLSGPFVPIYGFGALIIAIIGRFLGNLSPVLFWTGLILSPTILEYLVAVLMETFFGLTLWDYRHEILNLQGRICLKFSIYWTILVVFANKILEPWAFSKIASLGPYLTHFFSGALLMYFIMDTIHSVRAVFNFKAVMADLQKLLESGGKFLTSFDLISNALGTAEGLKQKLPQELKRLLKPIRAFPVLREELRSRFSVFPEWIREQLEKRIGK
ncbi:putative ABC transporter permease [Gracilinema caldarium]|uniref:putative ABC transporter permease n=1 Tax=Gracilinema caldarium TaxID=215591 RepID=UPI0026F07FF7|nr:putative ABC transporter permease [Gracilinema caldarium]